MISRRHMLVGTAGLLSAVLLASSAFAITPEDIKKKGKLIVGIQGDNPPWGFVDSSGKQQGLDADIAELFGKELGVPVEFVPLEVNNRIPALTTGRVDVFFVTWVSCAAPLATPIVNFFMSALVLISADFGPIRTIALALYGLLN